MKRVLSRLVPLFVPACMVDTPVAEAEGPDDRLGAGLSAWCESMCARYSNCEPDVDVEQCPSACAESFVSTFVGSTDVCTEAGLGLMDCMEGASCDELTSGESCDGDEALDRCLASRGLAACREESIGVAGSAGYAGSGGAPPSGFCDIQLGDCSDGRDYGIRCHTFDEGPVCECSVDGAATGRFAPNALGCPEDGSRAKQICAWPVIAPGGDPRVPPIVECRVSGGDGSAGGANAAECGVVFGDCSDGRTYEVDCVGSPGSVTCTCFVDGQVAGTNESAAGICPFVWDYDGGVVAANHACGFRIAPPMEF